MLIIFKFYKKKDSIILSSFKFINQIELFYFYIELNLLTII